MTRYFRYILLALFLPSAPGLLHASPRDAASVINRCGQPLRGDETIYENTVAGGRRILRYARATLNFDRVANDGWTFTYGDYGSATHLPAAQMSEHLPCLHEALADAAAPVPLPKVTSVDRAKVSLKHSLRQIIEAAATSVTLIGIVLLVWSRRPQDTEGLVG